MALKIDEALRNKTALKATKDEALLEVARDDCRNFLFATAPLETRTLFLSAWVSGFAAAHALDRGASDPDGSDEDGEEPNSPLPPDTLSPQMYC
jgi:hypothetical protein